MTTPPPSPAAMRAAVAVLGPNAEAFPELGRHAAEIIDHHTQAARLKAVQAELVEALEAIAAFECRLACGLTQSGGPCESCIARGALAHATKPEEPTT